MTVRCQRVEISCGASSGAVQGRAPPGASEGRDADQGGQAAHSHRQGNGAGTHDSDDTQGQAGTDGQTEGEANEGLAVQEWTHEHLGGPPSRPCATRHASHTDSTRHSSAT
jgi:hypothetical protein